jgi:hypothetical protein
MRPKIAMWSDYGSPTQKHWRSPYRRSTRSSIGPKILLAAVVVVASVISISGIYPQIIDSAWVQNAGSHSKRVATFDAATTRRSGIVAAIPLPPRRAAITTGEAAVSARRPLAPAAAPGCRAHRLAPAKCPPTRPRRRWSTSVTHRPRRIHPRRLRWRLRPSRLKGWSQGRGRRRTESGLSAPRRRWSESGLSAPSITAGTPEPTPSMAAGVVGAAAGAASPVFDNYHLTQNIGTLSDH